MCAMPISWECYWYVVSGLCSKSLCFENVWTASVSWTLLNRDWLTAVFTQIFSSDVTIAGESKYLLCHTLMSSSCVVSGVNTCSGLVSPWCWCGVETRAVSSINIPDWMTFLSLLLCRNTHPCSLCRAARFSRLCPPAEREIISQVSGGTIILVVTPGYNILWARHGWQK